MIYIKLANKNNQIKSSQFNAMTLLQHIKKIIDIFS